MGSSVPGMLVSVEGSLDDVEVSIEAPSAEVSWEPTGGSGTELDVAEGSDVVVRSFADSPEGVLSPEDPSLLGRSIPT